MANRTWSGKPLNYASCIDCNGSGKESAVKICGPGKGGNNLPGVTERQTKKTWENGGQAVARPKAWVRVSWLFMEPKQAEQWRQDNETAFPFGNDCPVTCSLWLLSPPAATASFPPASQPLRRDRGVRGCGGPRLSKTWHGRRSSDPAVSVSASRPACWNQRTVRPTGIFCATGMSGTTF